MNNDKLSSLAAAVKKMEFGVTDCPGCGQPVEALLGVGIQFWCDDCLDAGRLEETRERERIAKAARDAEWRRMVPPIYRESDLEHPGLSPAVVQVARDYVSRKGWQDASCPGLGLIGPSRMGKTRLAYRILRAQLARGMNVFAIRSKEHGAHAVTAAGGGSGDRRERAESQAILSRCKRADSLLIDDLGKIALTPRSIEAFEDLIESRTSHGRPIIFTSNASSVWLSESLGADSGPAIINRLNEFCTIHSWAVR